MKKIHLVSIQVALLAGGAFAAVTLSSTMFDEGKLNPQPNVLHLKRSPFGRTLALAMRGPVDIYWHRGAPHDHGNGHGEEECHEDHEHGLDCEHAHGSEGEHGDHQHEEIGFDPTEALATELERLSGDQPKASGEADKEAPAEESGLRQSLLGQIDVMRTAYYSRTNNRADSRLHKAFIMGETQKRLKVSFEMDPTNIAGYGAYFLFLSEALARVEGDQTEEGVIRNRKEAALNLAHYTIGYCLNFTDEAPAMMTAANAAHDYFQIYLAQPNPDLHHAGEFLQTLDQCLGQYQRIRREMQADGRWEKFPAYRAAEMENAYSLVRKLRDLDHRIFSKLSGDAQAAPAGS